MAIKNTRASVIEWLRIKKTKAIGEEITKAVKKAKDLGDKFFD